MKNQIKKLNMKCKSARLDGRGLKRNAGEQNLNSRNFQVLIRLLNESKRVKLGWFLADA